MRTAFDLNISESFVLDEERIISLAKILQNYAGEPSISATCADDATRSFENVEELFEYENPRSGRITSLDMDSYAGLKEANAHIRFTTKAWATPALYIRVSGPEEQALLAMRKLDEVAAGSLPWHSRISKRDIPPFSWVGWLIVAAFSFPVAVTLIPPSTLIEFRLRAYWGFLIGGLFWIFVLVASYVTRILFPPAVFLIGQEKERHATKQWQQKLALGALVTVGGVVLTWLLSML